MSRPKVARSHHKHRGRAPEVYTAPTAPTTPHLRAVTRAEGLAAIITYALGELDVLVSNDPDEADICVLADEIRRRVKEVLG